MKRIAAAAAAALLAFAFVAGSAAENGKQTIKMITWSNQPTVDAFTSFNKEFSAKYPNIEVKLEVVETNQFPAVLATRLAAKDVDLVTLPSSYFSLDQVPWAKGQKMPEWQSQMEAGVFADLSEKAFTKAWSTGAKAGTYKSKVYAISTGSNIVTGIYYNKKIFKDQGIAVPQTWAELETACKKLQAAGIAPMTCGAKDDWPFAMLANFAVASVEPDNLALAKGLWTGSRKFTDSKSLLIFKRLEELSSWMEDGFLGIDYGSVPGRFMAGKAAMLPDGGWQAPTIKAADLSFEFGYFPVPSDKPGNQFQGKFDAFLAVPSASGVKSACMNWLAMFSQKDNYQAFANTTGFIPTMDGVTVSDPFVASLLPYVKGLSLAWELSYRAPTGVGKYAEQRGFIPVYLRKAGGSFSIEELAAAAQKDFSDAVAKLK
jgi:raffinose/stachyose/melibiose transport system substrate-binding protein